MGTFFPCSLKTKPPWQPQDNSKGEGHSRPRSEPSSPWHDLHAHPLQSCSIATTAPHFDVLACPVSHPAPHPEKHAQGTSPSGRKYRCQAGSASPAPWAFPWPGFKRREQRMGKDGLPPKFASAPQKALPSLPDQFKTTQLYTLEDSHGDFLKI